MTIELTIPDLQAMNRATFDAFIESNRYALTYQQASEQFGRAKIDLLVNNGLLENRGSYKAKKRYYISDIVAGIETLNKIEL